MALCAQHPRSQGGRSAEERYETMGGGLLCLVTTPQITIHRQDCPTLSPRTPYRGLILAQTHAPTLTVETLGAAHDGLRAPSAERRMFNPYLALSATSGARTSATPTACAGEVAPKGASSRNNGDGAELPEIPQRLAQHQRFSLLGAHDPSENPRLSTEHRSKRREHQVCGHCDCMAPASAYRSAP